MTKNGLKARLRRWLDYTWRGPSAGWLIAFALVLMLGLGTLIAVGILGLNQGLRDMQVERQALVEDHLQKGEDYLNSGRLGLAAAEFEMVLQLDPTHVEAARRLQLVETLAVGTPPPNVATPALIPPPTPDLALLTRENLFEQAHVAIQEAHWLTATVMLDQLVELDPDYRRADVEAMRFGAAYRLGQALAAADKFAEADAAFDRALDIRPADVETMHEQELAALTASALTAWDEDWPIVLDKLQTVQELQPGYADVDMRIAAALEAWGDDETSRRAWCQAVEHYAEALTIAPSDQLRAKHNQARQACTQPSATPTATATATPATDETPQPVPTNTPSSAGGTGRIYFASFSDEFQRWTLYQLPMTRGGTTSPVTEGASQPAPSANGRQLAMRSERGDQRGLIQTGIDGSNRRRLTTFAEDSHPSWAPDGTQIAFDSNREGDRRWRIYHTWAGSGEATAINYGRWPAWSPQGDAIAFQGCDETGNRCGLWLMAPQGGSRRPVTAVPGDAMPAWSPDGSALAFASAERSGNWDLYLLDLESQRVTTLAAGSAVDAHPSWSPDGSQVAFLSNRNGSWGIYVVRVTTGEITRAATLPGSLPDWFEAQITWGR